jgi:hypothetical protein
LMTNAFIITIFPAGDGRYEEVGLILKNYGEVAYDKCVSLTQRGQLNLLRLLYEGETWLGSSADKFAGAREKATGCFSREAATRFMLFIARPNSDVVEAKRLIRKLFNVGNDSIHINDNPGQTLRIGQAVFNSNSVHFLNFAKPILFPNFERLSSEYKKLVANTGDCEGYCIDGSSVLACYGIRDCCDLDYLHHGAPLLDDVGAKIFSHNKEAIHYAPLSSLDIIYDPRYHFYSRGMKFASMDVIRSAKKNRDELKDRDDLELIESST